MDFLFDGNMRTDTHKYVCQCTHKDLSKSSRPEKFCGVEGVDPVEILFQYPFRISIFYTHDSNKEEWLLGEDPRDKVTNVSKKEFA